MNLFNLGSNCHQHIQRPWLLYNNCTDFPTFGRSVVTAPTCLRTAASPIGALQWNQCIILEFHFERVWDHLNVFCSTALIKKPGMCMCVFMAQSTVVILQESSELNINTLAGQHDIQSSTVLRNRVYAIENLSCHCFLIW